MFALGCLTACHSDGTTLDNNDEKEIPLSPNESEEKINKPKGIWIDAHANLSRFATKDAITSYLEKIKDTGFNEIYLDVKPGIGYALYDSDILAPLTKWGDEIVNRDFDYLGFWLEEAERLDIDVIATISAMAMVIQKGKKGRYMRIADGTEKRKLCYQKIMILLNWWIYVIRKMSMQQC
ncbi:hypothetical protein KUBF_18180 [Bacteroides finegoldii]|nr:hypothetical protein KUBF_18180 [Bacteroides finegoldii]